MKSSGKVKRHSGRKLAVQVLYSLSFAGPAQAPDLRKACESALSQTAGDDQGHAGALQDNAGASETEYCWHLVQGVWSNRTRLDEAIDSLSTNWRRDRMGRVELAILRLALYELLMEKISAVEVISEAKSLCHEFDVGEAFQLIHGIVDAASRQEGDGGGEKAASNAYGAKKISGGMGDGAGKL